ncbi:hypothetical protein ABIB62_001082 [Mucilaginibacter sp. UYP25]|uniref:hypothetical protein n=1 Tax=unclassified Mucilaginibacter TaxID=2617802 RepID=UPI00339605E1
MKKLLLLAAIGLLPYFASAQRYNASRADSVTNTPAETYCIVSPSRVIFGEKVSLDIDYGIAGDENDDKTLVDTKGKKIKFNSLAEALNYMAQRGWLFVNTLRYGADDYSRYLFRRKTSNIPSRVN